MNKLDKTKYKNVILYLCESLGGSIEGKKKLAKLLYFVDFDMFEYKESMKTITGDTYKAFPMGPVPEIFMYIIENMQTQKEISRKEKKIGNGYLLIDTFKAEASPDMSVFSTDEKFILNRVISKYSKLNGKQLEDLTHGEAPWNGVRLGENIPFELTFYRDTEFV